jgi:arginine/lysine/ornithine decarboxylase
VTEVPPAPYADALHRNAEGHWTRLGVPGHQDQPEHHRALASLAGPELLAMDIPMFTEGVDLPDPGSDEPSPLQQAMALAAEAWGARRTWFLTNGASQGNHVACLALRSLGATAVVQRSVHTSVIDGAILAGLRLEFVLPSIDPALGIAHGVTANDLDARLKEHPDAAAAYVVTPSYFGACADVVALAKVAHGHGIPLVVDEAWGSHFGFHPELPASALQSGADLVISSTHKLGGSLTQSAMLHLADGPYADLLEPLIERAMTTVQTTSPSAILFASLDLARRDLQLNGLEGIGASVADLERARALLNERGRFVDPDPSIHAAPDVIALDPLRIVVDTRSGGTPGYVARRLLEERSNIHVEMATDSWEQVVVSMSTTSWTHCTHCLRWIWATIPPSTCRRSPSGPWICARRTSAPPNPCQPKRPRGASRRTRSPPIRPGCPTSCRARSSPPRSSTSCARPRHLPTDG